VSKLDFHRLDLSYNEITGGDSIVGRYPGIPCKMPPGTQEIRPYSLSKGLVVFLS